MQTFKVSYSVWNSHDLKEDKRSFICTEEQVPGVKRFLSSIGCTGRITAIVKPGQPKPKSKAQLKREADAKRTMTERLTLTLEDFKDLYLKQSVKYEERVLAGALVNAKDQLKLHEEKGIAYNIKWAKSRVERIEREIKRESTNHLNWLNRANKSYLAKFSKLVDKLISYGFTTRLSVKTVASEDPREFSFLVEENGRVVHARTILAWGEIIRPHYRFITTERAAIS